jgi:transcriptional regulator with XRE-family HTH domain
MNDNIPFHKSDHPQATAALAAYAKFGVRLRAARTSAGLSTHTLAGAVDWLITPSAIGAYERGERDIPLAKVYLLASALDIPVESLVSDEAAGVQRIAELIDDLGYAVEGWLGELPPTSTRRAQAPTIDPPRLNDVCGADDE